MQANGDAALRRVWAVAGAKLRGSAGVGAVKAGLAALAFVLAGAAEPVLAQERGSTTPYVISNDRGGLLTARLRELRKLRASGRPVEIRGRVCLSTCTMFLGLPQTCISPQTSFGFHGPTRFGMPLDRKTFDYASRVIANHYPAPLQSWYMETGRERTRGMHRIQGSEIIRMGVKRC